MDRGQLLIIAVSASIGLASVLLFDLPAKIRGEIGYEIQNFVLVGAFSWLALSLALFVWRQRKR